MTQNIEPWPRPFPGYSSTWANRLIQRLDKESLLRTLGERLVQGTFITNGGRRRKVTSVTESYQITLSDEVIDSNVGSAVTHTLPANPSPGQEFEIQDSSGDASSFPISVAPPGGINLNGAASAVQLVTSDYGRGKVLYNGTQYIAS